LSFFLDLYPVTPQNFVQSLKTLAKGTKNVGTLQTNVNKGNFNEESKEVDATKMCCKRTEIRIGEDPRDMKNGVFWDVTPCGAYKNRRFGHPDKGGAKIFRNVGSYKSHRA
jgi:hypothetical protein